MTEEQLNIIKEQVIKILMPIKAVDSHTQVNENMSVMGVRTIGGGYLANYYLVYFLLVDLLGFYSCK